MDLTYTLGYKSVAEMLDTIDSVEYDFWLEKYRQVSFGTDMINTQLAQVSWAIANAFGGTFIPLEQFIMGEIGAATMADSDKAAVRMIGADYYGYFIKEGYSEKDAERMAGEEQTKYSNNLRNKRLEEAMEENNNQDLGE